jgi:copper resistance protein D
MEIWDASLRFLQYGAGVIGLGMLTAFLWADEPISRQGRAWLAFAGVVLGAAAAGDGARFFHAVLGSWGNVFSAEGASFMLSTFAPAWGYGARAALAFIAAVTILLPAGRANLWLATAIFAASMASFAWTGHGGMTTGSSGLFHKASTIAHILAATMWLGALGLFLFRLLRSGRGTGNRQRTASLLSRFSGLGSLLVIILAITGSANTVFIIGPERLSGATGTGYGMVLAAKLVLFAGMLALAALNRFTLAPALARSPAEAQSTRLKAAIGVEMVLGFGVMTCVAVLGTLDPHGM